jgi:hypothetical protein
MLNKTKNYCILLTNNKNKYGCDQIACGSFNCAFKININKEEYVMKISSKNKLEEYIKNVIPKHILFDLIFCVFMYDDTLKKYNYTIINNQIDDNLLSEFKIFFNNIDDVNIIKDKTLTIEKYIKYDIFYINTFNTSRRLKYTLLFLLDSLIQIKYINFYADFKPDNIKFEYNNNKTRDMFKIIDYSKGDYTHVFLNILNPNNNIYYDIIKNNFNKYYLYKIQNNKDFNLNNIKYNIYYDYHCILYSLYILLISIKVKYKHHKEYYSDDNIIIYL